MAGGNCSDGQIELLEATQRLISATTAQETADIAIEVITTAFEMSYAGVHLYDDARSALVPIAWSDPVEEVLDTPPELGEGSLAWEVYQENTLRAVEHMQAVDAIENPETPFRSEIIVPLGDHGVLLVSFVESPTIEEMHRQLARILGANVTAALDRIDRERTLRSFEQGIEYSGHSIVITDPDGTIEYVNPAFEEITGYTTAEAIGRNPRILQSGEHDVAFYRAMWETITDGEVWRNEITNQRKDGETLIVDQTIAPVFDDNDEIIKFVAVNTDITDRKKHEQELQRERDRLDEFASVVSHDLRNPVNVAELRLDLAEDDCDSEHLDAIEDALGRMQRIIDDVLWLAREGKDIGATESVALRDAIEDAWTIAAGDVAEAEIVYTAGKHRTMDADYDRLCQLLENIFGNAVEHGGPDVTVTVGELEDGFFVADDGPGIPEDDREDVFEDGYSTAQGGTGFGLSIVSQVVDAHGWEIRVTESTAGGARFEITGIEPSSKDAIDTESIEK